jgi:hypothetical protein
MLNSATKNPPVRTDGNSESFLYVFNLDLFLETTACEKPLFTVEVFVFEHFFYSVLTP